jgi:hypothetical protein
MWNTLWEWVVEERAEYCVRLFVSWDLLGLQPETYEIWFALLLHASAEALQVKVSRLHRTLVRRRDHFRDGDELNNYVPQGNEIMLNDRRAWILFPILSELLGL